MFVGTYADRVHDSFVVWLICCIEKNLVHPILYIDC